MRSTPTLLTLRQQITMALMRLLKRQTFSMYTPCNRIHFVYMWTHLSYTYVNMCSCYWDPFSQCNHNPSQSDKHHLVVNSTCSTSNFPWLQYVFQSFFSLVGPRNLLKMSVPSIDTGKHCYHTFLVFVWSPSVTYLALHKHLYMCGAPSNPKKSYWNRLLFLINFR